MAARIGGLHYYFLLSNKNLSGIRSGDLPLTGYIIHNTNTGMKSTQLQDYAFTLNGTPSQCKVAVHPPLVDLVRRLSSHADLIKLFFLSILIDTTNADMLYLENSRRIHPLGRRAWCKGAVLSGATEMWTVEVIAVFPSHPYSVLSALPWPIDILL